MNSKFFTDLKARQEDFEFYPTTDEILEVITQDIKQISTWVSVLDIGAGNGKFYNFVANKDKDLHPRERLKIEQYRVIEKSQTLINLLPKEAIIVGTDFHNTTIIDKKSDIIFCNPPYSEFVNWTYRILSEAQFTYAYFVIPQRWKENDKIKDILTKRNIEIKGLGEFDFLEAERAARCNVEIVRFEMKANDYDPFTKWFKETFNVNFENKQKEGGLDDYYEKKRVRESMEREKSQALIKNGVPGLVTLYNEELQGMQSQYQQLCKLDFSLLKEFGVDLDMICRSLKDKIHSLKNAFWTAFFDNMHAITSKLCHKQRDSMRDTLLANSNVDFTEENIYAVLIWACKNANTYFDAQLLDLFKNLSLVDSIRKYKSNQNVFGKDRWGYLNESRSHYTLDYRIIAYSYDNRQAGNLLNDLRVVASNLGFDKVDSYGVCVEQDAVTRTVECYNPLSKKEETLVSYKWYKNNNLHLKINKTFMKAFNIEVARLQKWVHDKSEIVNEFDESNEITPQDIESFFNTNVQIQEAKLLLEHFNQE